MGEGRIGGRLGGGLVVATTILNILHLVGERQYGAIMFNFGIERTHCLKNSFISFIKTPFQT